MGRMEYQKRRGFTLVELLIVVIILGILAAVVMPKFDNPPRASREAALVTDLHAMRKAIELYAAQHDGVFPGTIAGAGTWENFVTHMTTKTDIQGNPGIQFGPYLRTGVPKNPYNGLNTGTVGPIPAVADDVTGWYYNPKNGEFRANSTEVTKTCITAIEK